MAQEEEGMQAQGKSHWREEKREEKTTMRAQKRR
jgi:hypothetical protein